MSGGASLPQNEAKNFQYPHQDQAASGALGGIQNFNTNPLGGYNSGGSLGAGSALTGAAQPNIQYAQQALGNAFDPQQALFAKQFQQQQDQGNVANAQNGVAGTPYGAGLSQQGNQNFDIAWQHQQLQNQNTGANTASALLGSAGGAAQTGTGIGQSTSVLNNSQVQQQIMDFLAYLQGGTGASGAANQAYQTGVTGAIDNQKLSDNETAGFGKLGGDLLGLFL